MSRLTYTEQKLLPGEKEVPSIDVDAEALYDLLLRAQPMMSATNRRVYGDRALMQIQDVIAEFVLAYDFEDDRLYHLKRMWAAIAVFVRTMRRIAEHNAIEIPLKHEPLSPGVMRLEIFQRIARLEEGADRWRKSVVGKARKKKRMEQGHDPLRGEEAVTERIKEAPPPGEGG